MSAPTTKINVVIPLKNRGKHLRLLLKNIQEIVNETNENNIKIWIGDFHSSDVDLKRELDNCTFESEIVWFDGVFVIGRCLQVTAENIKNPDEIIYFCDVDSVFPTCIFERIREQTIQGKQFYVPMVSRETRSRKLLYPFPPNDHGGKGNVGVYVSDFVKSGGWRIGYFYQDGKNKGGDPFTRKQWGKHDEHIFHLLKIGCGLISARPKEKDQWIRWHPPRQGWGK